MPDARPRLENLRLREALPAGTKEGTTRALEGTLTEGGGSVKQTHRRSGRDLGKRKFDPGKNLTLSTMTI